MKEVLITVIIVAGILAVIALLSGNVEGIVLALPGVFYFTISMFKS